MTKRKDIGNTGEHIAEGFLETKGFVILGKNYNKKWGEIDIIARKDNMVHFVEVKTISRETGNESIYRPEENMHKKKIERLHRAIQSYLGEFDITHDWQLDLVTVTLFIKDKKAECALIENVL
tara:strand:+ start:98 stop:466 length:369 start_codon:yes stop_codon:yes gene_type:complete